MKSSLILGIETSCDDTSVALVRNNKLLDCIVISSAELQANFGGVVPELAAREHEKYLLPSIRELLARTGVYWREVTHIAYTSQPGLVGCLLVGQVFAKTLSLASNKPLIAVDHIYSHIFSVGLTAPIKFPFLALVISGKTTALYFVNSFTDIELLEDTADNAIGEVYDKVARELGLKYPGGAAIDALFNRDRKVPNLLKHKTNPAQRFSYSGILSAVVRLCKFIDRTGIENRNEYVATMFQKWVIDGLISKLKYWINKKDVRCVYVSGGVAANKYLREELEKINTDVFVVDKKFSGDN
ncbi:tRNA (adenosine(37)-N6)-threonylcarbamoyltransferase complex transferase subunit TsaD, partial [Candidatus Mycoplasma haematohominis]|uniref:tRNA (adenosine(37)-N6)-threonylcarbamoyltransferase complex transferase subunit TsaD n=1 Tax=Candidatus Mycoplasma haematohominis TaxID=1494318 RepID=UPI001C0A7544